MKRRIDQVMTKQPFTVGREQTLDTAHQIMRKRKVRHLPVLEGGKVVGVLSERDLYFLESIAGVDARKDRVEDAMTAEVYGVAPDALVTEVAAYMARRRYGCAVVMDGAQPVGIFTAIDALRILGEKKARPLRRSTT